MSGMKVKRITQNSTIITKEGTTIIMGIIEALPRVSINMGFFSGSGGGYNNGGYNNGNNYDQYSNQYGNKGRPGYEYGAP